MKLISDDANQKPTVGELLYREYVNDDGSFHNASLFFIDSPVEEGDYWSTANQWPIVTVAMIEDFGNGPELYALPEAGGAKQEYTRKATDDDIFRMVNVGKSMDNGTQVLEEWLREVKESGDYEPLKENDKQRLEKIISENL